MGKDVILDRYARLYEIPYQLARLGHEVKGYCLDYHGIDEGQWIHEAKPGALEWESASVGRLRLPKLLHYPLHLRRRLTAFSPDLLVGASDIPHVVLAARLSRYLGVPYAVDLYDNFESFGQARIPGFVSALRSATRDAGLVTTTSMLLKRLVEGEYKARGKVVAMPSSVDHAVFQPMNRAEARASLGLPPDVKLIGTAGGLYREKGIEPLYEAWKKLSTRYPDVHLVLAGPVARSFLPPTGTHVHYLGHLRHAQIATLFNALDVGVISVLDTPFGRYCFPQKASEMLACALPVVAADVGATGELFADTPAALFPPGDARGLVLALERQLTKPNPSSRAIPDWCELLSRVEPEMRALVNSVTRH